MALSVGGALMSDKGRAWLVDPVGRGWQQGQRGLQHTLGKRSRYTWFIITISLSKVPDVRPGLKARHGGEGHQGA